MAQFGPSQIGNEAPLLYKRLTNFFIMSLIPLNSLIATLWAGHFISADTAYIISASLTFVGSMLKIVQQLLGAEPTQTVTDATGTVIPPK